MVEVDWAQARVSTRLEERTTETKATTNTTKDTRGNELCLQKAFIAGLFYHFFFFSLNVPTANPRGEKRGLCGNASLPSNPFVVGQPSNVQSECPHP